jgi:hypothetical protein
VAANPPADHDAQAQRAHAGGWFRQHWKEVLALVIAAIPVAAYFLLRGQASGQGSSNVLPSGAFLSGGSSGGSAPPPPATTSSTSNTPINPADWKFIGNSWLYAPNGDTTRSFVLNGMQYTFLPNVQAALAALSAGQTLWWFPEPGAAPQPGAIPGTTGAGYVATPISPTVNSNASAQVFSGL